MASHVQQAQAQAQSQGVKGCPQLSRGPQVTPYVEGAKVSSRLSSGPAVLLCLLLSLSCVQAAPPWRERQRKKKEWSNMSVPTCLVGIMSAGDGTDHRGLISCLAALCLSPQLRLPHASPLH
eukprot:gene15699-21807_t